MYLGLCGLRSLLRHRGGTSRHYHERIPRTKSRKESIERKTSSMFHTRSRWTWWFYTKRDHHQGNPWSWANFAGLAQLYAMPDGQHQTALGQCRYADHKKNIFGTSTSTSTTVSCSRKVLLLAYVGSVLWFFRVYYENSTNTHVDLYGLRDEIKQLRLRTQQRLRWKIWLKNQA